MSAFAAGCAACGADLEAYHRRERLAAEQAATRPSRGWRLPRPDVDLTLLEGAWLLGTLAAVAWISALGILLAVLGGMHAYYEDRRRLLVAYVVLGVLALALEVSRL